METRIKHPSTPHLPWSQEVAGDDKKITTLAPFAGREIWVSEKMDGESTTGYYPGVMHARSLDSAHNETRDWIKSMMTGMGYQFPRGWRFVFENVAYYHSINYRSLPSFAYLLMIWNEQNVRLAYDDICEWADKLDLAMPRCNSYESLKVVTGCLPSNMNEIALAVIVVSRSKHRRFNLG